MTPSASNRAELEAGRLGTYSFEKLGYETASVLVSDYAYGREISDSFIASFEAAGGTVIETLYTPLGTADFGTLLTSIPDADVLLGAFAGADALRLVRQYSEFGVDERMPLIGHGPIITELLLDQEGDAAIGVSAGFYYSSAIELPENERFKAALAATNPEMRPSHATASGWAVGSLLLDVADRMNGDLSDGTATSEAILATNVDAPWGDLTFNPASRFAEPSTFYYTAVKDAEGLHHEILDVIE